MVTKRTSPTMTERRCRKVGRNYGTLIGALDLSGRGRSTGREYWEEGITKGGLIFSTDPLFVFWRGTHRMGT